MFIVKKHEAMHREDDSPHTIELQGDVAFTDTVYSHGYITMQSGTEEASLYYELIHGQCHYELSYEGTLGAVADFGSSIDLDMDGLSITATVE